MLPYDVLSKPLPESIEELNKLHVQAVKEYSDLCSGSRNNDAHNTLLVQAIVLTIERIERKIEQVQQAKAIEDARRGTKESNETSRKIAWITLFGVVVSGALGAISNYNTGRQIDIEKADLRPWLVYKEGSYIPDPGKNGGTLIFSVENVGKQSGYARIHSSAPFLRITEGGQQVEEHIVNEWFAPSVPVEMTIRVDIADPNKALNNTGYDLSLTYSAHDVSVSTPVATNPTKCGEGDGLYCTVINVGVITESDGAYKVSSKHRMVK